MASSSKLRYVSGRPYPAKKTTQAQYLAEAERRLKIKGLQSMVAGSYSKNVVAGASIAPFMIVTSAARQSADAVMQALLPFMGTSSRSGSGALQAKILNHPQDFEDLNRTIALRAQRSTLGGLASRHPRRDLPAYRAGATDNRTKRYANGRLRRAIASPLFFQVDPRTIRFINKAVLNKEAVHWRRLNFGTRGGAALRPPAEFRIHWGKNKNGGDLIAAAFGLAPDVRPAFRIPPGAWIEPGMFYPVGELPKGATGITGGGNKRAGKRGPGRRARSGSWTRGIASTNFMDAGVERIARELGPVYFGKFDEWFGTGVPNAVINQRIQVRVPRLRGAGTDASKGRSLGAAYREGGFNQKPGATYYGSRGGGIGAAVARLIAGRR